MAIIVSSPPQTRLDNGGGAFIVTSGGAITISPLAGQHTTITAGSLRVVDGSAASPGLAFASETGTGFRRAAGQTVTAVVNGGDGAFAWNQTDFQLRSDGSLKWTSSTSPFGSPDTVLVRDAADTLAQRRGTNAQEVRLYNTYTDASNNERLRTWWTGNVIFLMSEANGTGTARAMGIGTQGSQPVNFRTAAANRWTLDASGNLVPAMAQSTGMTAGFVHVAGAAGVPSGTPTGSGGVPLYYDTTNKKLYAYSGGAWLSTAAFT